MWRRYRHNRHTTLSGAHFNIVRCGDDVVKVVTRCQQTLMATSYDVGTISSKSSHDVRRSCAADRPTTLTMSLRYRQVVGAVDPARPARPARDGPNTSFAYKNKCFQQKTVVLCIKLKKGAENQPKTLNKTTKNTKENVFLCFIA